MTPQVLRKMPTDAHAKAVDSLLDELDLDQHIRLVHERKRKKDHAQAKLTQPEVPIALPPDQWAKVQAVLLAPLTQEERETQSGLDYLCQTVKDCAMAGNQADTLFAAIRVVRWAWAHQPHLGHIHLES